MDIGVYGAGSSEANADAFRGRLLSSLSSFQLSKSSARNKQLSQLSISSRILPSIGIKYGIKKLFGPNTEPTLSDSLKRYVDNERALTLKDSFV